MYEFGKNDYIDAQLEEKRGVIGHDVNSQLEVS
jgi:hypothetical protein